MTLTQDDVRFYHKNGYLIAPLLEADDLQPIIDQINEEIERRAGEFKAEGKIVDSAEDLGFERRLDVLYQQCPEIAQDLDINQLQLRSIFDFFFNQRLLDALQSLLGPELSLSPIQHLRPKMPTHGVVAEQSYYGDVPWHQDAAVTWEEADETDIVTVWIPLVDATEENGCMQILPRVHLDRECLVHGDGASMLNVPDVEPVLAECPRQSVVFMGQFTPHMGLSNISDTIRWTLDLRYQRTDTPSGRPFYPSFVVRSDCDPNSVQRDYQAWRQAWDDAIGAETQVPWHRTTPRVERDAALATWRQEQSQKNATF